MDIIVYMHYEMSICAEREDVPLVKSNTNMPITYSVCLCGSINLFSQLKLHLTVKNDHPRSKFTAYNNSRPRLELQITLIYRVPCCPL